MRERCVVANARITSSRLDSTGKVCMSGPGTMISRTWICESSMALRMNFSSPAASSPRSRACWIWICNSSVECATPCAGEPVEETDDPPKGVEKPAKRNGHEQGHAFGAREAHGLRDELPHDQVKGTEQREGK